MFRQVPMKEALVTASCIERERVRERRAKEVTKHIILEVLGVVEYVAN